MTDTTNVQNAVREIHSLSKALKRDPYSIITYCERARHHYAAGYPDLAVTDLYKALLLSDDVAECGEYHKSILPATKKDMHSAHFRLRLADLTSYLRLPETALLTSLSEATESPSFGLSEAEVTTFCRTIWCVYCPVGIAHHLASIGCLRTARTFIQRVLAQSELEEAALQEKHRIETLSSEGPSCGEVNDTASVKTKRIPDNGMVRREIYPWNEHEQQRLTNHSVSYLNRKLSQVSQKLEVKLTDLPILRTSTATSIEPANYEARTKQLGLFATEDILPGECILLERSLLATNARTYEPLCDACSSNLPQIGEREIFSCESCDDVAFCSAICRDLAQSSYHQGICGVDVEDVGKSVDAARAADALYTQLLLRAMSMSVTQAIHPLELDEVKFIWGDFECMSRTIRDNSTVCGDDAFFSQPRSLPYDFQAQVIQPLHLLELLDINIFEAPNALAETWVYNTLYAKFRGTASSRISARDGRPEVAAVHPLWSLANHSCSPNVTWEWGAEAKFKARTKRAVWSRRDADGTVVKKQPEQDGECIRKGQEILNHYVDIDLPVHERRAWGIGALGGSCVCDRCVWEDTG